jgi:SSS family solute:Na+ symporter
VLLGLSVLFIYFFLMIFIDFMPAGRLRRKSPAAIDTDEHFFLSGKTLSVVALLISTAATNFSAFTILGLSGAGYRLGYAFYPVMAFGTGFMALAIYLIGNPLRELGHERNYISPVDFIRDRYGSAVLSKAFAVVLVILTLPYLALQPISAGIILESFFGVPYKVGVIICSIIVGLYTTRGGMRAVVKTDLIQGVIILVLAAAAYATVLRHMGGFSEAHARVGNTAPQLLERFGAAGPDGAMLGPLVLAGYIVLWFFADPMFPQLNQRFLAAKDGRALEKTVIIYPLVTMLLFFLTISLGVIGGGVLPGLSTAESDRIWPTLIAESARPALASIFMIAPLAAIMSTLDSQLLSLSSIIKRDLMGWMEGSRRSIRLITAVIALAGLIIALYPPDNILSFISKSSFLGYAALSPLVFGGLYIRRLNYAGAFSSVIAGAGLTLLSGLGVISFGRVPPVFIICGASWLAFIAGSAIAEAVTVKRSSGIVVFKDFPVFSLKEKLPAKWAAVFIILFVLSLDFLSYFILPESQSASVTGFPVWMYYQAGLCLLLAGVFYLFFRTKK